MTRVGNVWIFTGEPHGEGKWNTIQEYRVMNCEFEAVTLTQECDSCPVLSVFGTVSEMRAKGSAIHGYRTLVWGLGASQIKPCDLTKLPRRSVRLFNDSGVLRLRDEDQQMEFVQLPPVCRARGIRCYDSSTGSKRTTFSLQSVRRRDVKNVDRDASEARR